MLIKILRKSLLPLCVSAAIAIGLGQKKSATITADYQLVTDWPRLQSDDGLGQPSGLGIDSQGNLFVFHRAGADPVTDNPVAIPKNTIAELDPKTGELLASWGADRFARPHGLTVDHEDNVWVTDVGFHQVFKFSSEGELLMSLGERGVAGDNEVYFNKPTDVAVAKDGSFYVSDGYGNSRVLKFSAEGDFLFEWGEKGDGKGQFNLPHAISLDENGNVIVADRENGRIQVFDAKGHFLREWAADDGGKIYSVKADPVTGAIWAVDYLVDGDDNILGSDVLRFDAELNLRERFGRSGSYVGPVSRYHDIEINRDRNIFTADLLEHRVQKFTPESKKGD